MAPSHSDIRAPVATGLGANSTWNGFSESKWLLQMDLAYSVSDDQYFFAFAISDYSCS